MDQPRPPPTRGVQRACWSDLKASKYWRRHWHATEVAGLARLVMQFVLSPKRLAEAKNDPMMCNEYWRDTVRAMSLSAVTGALSHLLVFLKRVCSCLWNACWSSKPMMSSSLMSSVASEARLHKPSKEAGSTWASCMNTAKNRRGGHTFVHLFHAGVGGGLRTQTQ